MSRAQQIIGSGKNRVKDDFYATPPAATRALLSVEDFEGSIFEPMCGDGAISRLLEEKYPGAVTSHDLVDRGYGRHGYDFLQYSGPQFDHIVTNPPYKNAQAYVEKALDVSCGKVAMLLKLQFLEGTGRLEMFKRTPPARVYVFSDRLTFGAGSGMLCFAWFVWDVTWVGTPEIHWLVSREHESKNKLF